MDKYKFFSNKECEYFPCHNTEKPEEFNCIFCFCPLYALGENCGGGFTYTEDGVKDCSKCMIPHDKSGYDCIMSKWDQINEIAKRK